MFGAANAWHQVRSSLLQVLPWEVFGFLDVRLPGLLYERARQGNLAGSVGDFQAGERRVRQGAYAVQLLARHGITELDLLLAAFQLPWCDPALGGHRALAAERPVIRDWADAVLLATMSAEPRPGQDEDGAWASYLHHVRGMPPRVRAVVVASRYADVAAGGHAPEEAARRHARLVGGLDALAADLPALREEAARPPAWQFASTGFPRVTPAAARPCTDPDTALAIARDAQPWVGEDARVEEYDVGFLVHHPHPVPAAPQFPAPGGAPAAPGGAVPGGAPPPPGGLPAPGGRQAAVIVDRETGAPSYWWEFTVGHALARYQVRHRLFPLPLSEQGRHGTLLRYGLHQDLAGLGPALGRFDLNPVYREIQDSYHRTLDNGGDWPVLVDTWRIAVRAIRTLVGCGFQDVETLMAALAVARLVHLDHLNAADRYVQGLTGRTAELAVAARPPAPAFRSAVDAYARRLSGAPVEVRAVAAAVALARAEYARDRYRVGSLARYRELERLRELVPEVPGLREEAAGWLARNHPTTWGSDT
ncbi:hypothetical protein LI90_875 [Carbonactinospora thermoautotrophica]|uniref:Uncharacterized protein n=1 Tax=Carbonactinospora thermoautotrophica TaxID=1469144 RepID=A0A132MP97_9ACTN|nr:hypothetical protein LI90_875 [Carbonactinospora thermoautotrophica]